jgi:F0F1-type ATP synthase assembly protein I
VRERRRRRSPENRGASKAEKNFFATAAQYTAIAMTLPASTFAGYAIGYGLDYWLGTNFFKIVFLLLGIASGFLQIIRLLMRDMRNK